MPTVFVTLKNFCSMKHTVCIHEHKHLQIQLSTHMLIYIYPNICIPRCFMSPNRLENMYKIDEQFRNSYRSQT